MMMNYEPIIGLEIHAQLRTESKLFCGCGVDYGGEPNSQVCPVCLGLPGALPVLNRRAVELALRMALALNCDVLPNSTFARKHYFYPDLPKGYQISQYTEPLSRNGFVELEVENQSRHISIERIHLEEDAGKSIHAEEYVAEHETLVDFNRCGVPLIEIVTGPDLRSGLEAAAFLNHIRQTVQHLSICDGNMAEGKLRCDANVSVRPAGSKEKGVKTELKNMNSLRGVKKAIEFEINRQQQVLQRGEPVTQQTLSWNETRAEAVPIRSKELSDDYRYFPEPDLYPLQVDEKQIDAVKQSLPELPGERRKRLIEQYDLRKEDADLLTETPECADYFEQAAGICSNADLVSKWILREVFRVLKEKQITITEFQLLPDQLAELISLVEEGTLSETMAKSVFEELLQTGANARDVTSKKDLIQVSDAEQIRTYVTQVLAQHSDAVQKYLNGKEQVFGFLVGQVMHLSQGKANPEMAQEILRSELKKRGH